MAQRPRDESAILSGWVTLMLDFRLKGYVSRQYLWTFICENNYTTTLLWKFSRKETLADFIRLKLNFIKKQKIAFSATFGDLGVTYALHL